MIATILNLLEEANAIVVVAAAATMSTVTSIATQSAAKAAVATAVIVPINNVEYNLETCRKFSRTLFNAARTAPSPIGGGSNGHVYLLESVTEYTTRMGGTNYTKSVHPGAIDFTGATANTQLARVKETRVTNLENFHTQEDARAGL